MKSLLTLLFVFLSFNSFSQKHEAEEMRRSVFQNNEEIIQLQYLIEELESIKCKDSSSHFSKIKDFIRESIIQGDTLFIYTQGIMGHNSSRGRGDYDSLTLPYSFLYYDCYTNCIMDGCFFDGMQMYNEMIKKEITRRHGKNWESIIQAKIDKINPSIFEEYVSVNKLKFSFRINNKDVKTIKLKKIDKLKTHFANLESVKSELKNDNDTITASIWFFEENKSEEMFFDVELNNITQVVQEILAKKGKTVTLVDIYFDKGWNRIGSYHFKVK